MKYEVIFHNALGPDDGELDKREVEDGHAALAAVRELCDTAAELYIGDGFIFREKTA